MITSHTARSGSNRARPDKRMGNAPLYAPGGAEVLRESLIRTAAYFRAEHRGFAPGRELEDWLEAEREIDHWIETRGAPHRYRAPQR